MSIRADVEDIQTTRSEKLLAVLLAAFLLLGGVWTYQKIDDVVRAHVSVPSFASAGPASLRLQAAQRRVAAATKHRMRALQVFDGLGRLTHAIERFSDLVLPTRAPLSS